MLPLLILDHVQWSLSTSGPTACEPTANVTGQKEDDQLLSTRTDSTSVSEDLLTSGLIYEATINHDLTDSASVSEDLSTTGLIYEAMIDLVSAVYVRLRKFHTQCCCSHPRRSCYM